MNSTAKVFIIAGALYASIIAFFAIDFASTSMYNKKVYAFPLRISGRKYTHNFRQNNHFTKNSS